MSVIVTMQQCSVVAAHTYRGTQTLEMDSGRSTNTTSRAEKDSLLTHERLLKPNERNLSVSLKSIL